MIHVYEIDGKEFKWIVKGVAEFEQVMYLKNEDGKLVASFIDPAKAAYVKLGIDVVEDGGFDIVVDVNNKVASKFFKKIGDTVTVDLNEDEMKYVFKSRSLIYHADVVNPEFAKYVTKDLSGLEFDSQVVVDKKEFENALSLIETVDVMFEIADETLSIYGLEYGKKVDVEAVIPLDDYKGNDLTAMYSLMYLKYIAKMSKDKVILNFNSQEETYPLLANLDDFSLVLLAPRVRTD